MSNFPAPAPTYLGPPAHYSKGNNKPIDHITIHSTVSACVPGAARVVAAYFRTLEAGGSAHYVVDPAEVIQSAYDSVICWHAPPNAHSLGIEMCDMPALSLARWRRKTPPVHRASKWPLRWIEPNHRKMLRLTINLTAELCLAYDVPPVFLTPRMLRNGRRGITTHNNVSRAFHESTHWDPGFWPRRLFMREVRKEIARLKAAA
jgi:hypothetical protein